MPAWIDDGPGLTDVGIWEAPGDDGGHRQMAGFVGFPKREAGLLNGAGQPDMEGGGRWRGPE